MSILSAVFQFQIFFLLFLQTGYIRMGILRNIVYLLQAACFLHVFNEYVGELTFSLGPSMLPTLNMTGDLLAVERISHKRKRLAIGDVIVCISPTKPGVLVSKRILGMPGDYICVDPTQTFRKYITVPHGHVWLAGDNVSNSTDSRSYGPVPYALIRGRVFARLWPELGWISNNIIPIPKDEIDPSWL